MAIPLRTGSRRNVKSRLTKSFEATATLPFACSCGLRDF